jgi:UDP-N-acetylmuramoylalanine--D-glutamate ligase
LSSLAEKINAKTIVVAELSSYQLEDSPDFRPDISVILNITPDHLKHHKTMKNYIKAKSNVFINQKNKDFVIYNYQDKILRKITSNINATAFSFNANLKKTNTIYYENGNIYIRYKNKKITLSPDIKIPGRHNIDNILSSVAAAFLSGIKPDIIEKVISSFKGVEHRIEFVKNIKNISYYNDSKATNVDSTKVALEAFDKNIQLILGGQDKGSPYKPIYNLIKKKVKNIFLIGEATPIIKKELKGSAQMYECGTLLNALKKIRRLQKKKI